MFRSSKLYKLKLWHVTSLPGFCVEVLTSIFNFQDVFLINHFEIVVLSQIAKNSSHLLRVFIQQIFPHATFLGVLHWISVTFNLCPILKCPKMRHKSSYGWILSYERTCFMKIKTNYFFQESGFAPWDKRAFFHQSKT